MGKASSAKKVARAAKAGKGIKVRSQQGLVFPVALVAVIALGFGLVVYARQSGTTESKVRPVVAGPGQPGDHWHVAYGVYACDKFLPNIQTNSETDTLYGRTGIHTHGDGVMHVHPFGSLGSGKNAKLSSWFNVVGIKLTSNELTLPENLGGPFKDGADCNGKAAHLKVLVWNNANDAGQPNLILTKNLGDARFTKDGMAMTIAFVPDDAKLNELKPPSAANLAALGAIDTGAAPVTTVPTSSVAGDSSSTTVAGTGDSTSTTAPAADSTTTTAAAATSSSTG